MIFCLLHISSTLYTDIIFNLYIMLMLLISVEADGYRGSLNVYVFVDSLMTFVINIYVMS